MSQLRLPSSTNVFLPQATGQVVSAIRKKDRFAINNYAQLVKSPKLVAAYRKLGFDEAVRVNSVDESSWPDGQRAPAKNTELPHQFIPFRCQRYSWGFELGWLEVENAAPDWKMIVTHSDTAVCKLMTGRTFRMMTLLQDPTNWGSHTSTAQAIDGQAGFFDTASSDSADANNYNFSFRAVTAAANRIMRDTNSVVRWQDLRIVISPNFARRWAASSEIRQVFMNSVFALGQIRGDKVEQNALYGLPPKFAGIDITVEDATIVQERFQASGVEATSNRSFIKNDDSMLIVSQVGGLDGQYGAPSYSTVQLYYYEREMSIEARDHAWHKLTEGRAVEITAEVLTENRTGWLLQNCLSP